MRLGIICILLTCLAGGGASGKEGDDAKVEIVPRRRAVSGERSAANIRMNVQVVLVPVTVTDAMDRPVTTLSRDQFRLVEDGEEQRITSFVRSDGAVSLGLLFDSSGSMKDRIAPSITALKEFFATAMDGDEYFLVQFADQAHLLGGFTSNPDEIFAQLGTVRPEGWTALLDAVALGAHTMRSARNRSRALLILSDGNDNNSRFTETEIRRMVVESDVRVYAIGVTRLPRLLRQLADQTGGKVLTAHSLSDLPDVVQRLSAEIRSQYLIGYSPTNPSADGKYRTVKIELRQPAGAGSFHVSWRRGYYAPEY